MTTDPPRYRSYVLTLWQEGSQVWRCSLTDPHTGQRCGFASLEALLSALERAVDGKGSPCPGQERISLHGAP
jgi:hypothetical protein